MSWNPSGDNSIGRAKTSILVVIMPLDGCCRIPGCKQAGLYFKRLDKHLKRCHPGKSRQDNFVLLAKRPADRDLVKNTDRERLKCEVIGCRYYGVAVSRLDRHKRKVHRTTTEEREKKELMVECEFSSEEEDDADSCLFGEIARIVNNL